MTLIVLTRSQLDLESRVRSLSLLSLIPNVQYGKIEAESSIEKILKDEKRFLDRFLQEKPTIKNEAINMTKIHIGVLIEFAKGFDVDFDYLTSTIVKHFGIELAKIVVPIDAIIEVYGSSAGAKWKELVS